MKKSFFPFNFNYKEIYSEIRIIKGFEGGAIYTATKDSKYYLIVDEGTLADFLNDDDGDLLNQLVKIIEFETEEGLNNYLKEHYGKIYIR